jgi:hypothetical protein
MKKHWVLPALFALLSCMETQGATLTHFSAMCGAIRVDYGLPSGTRYLAGSPAHNVEFPTHADFPLMGGIAAVGWGFVREVPQIQIDLVIVKIGKPRFAEVVKPDYWSQILKEEGVSIPMPYSELEQVVLDCSGRKWLETIVEKEEKITARSYVRPIGPDLLLLLRINFMRHVTEKQRTEGMATQSKILESLAISRENRKG